MKASNFPLKIDLARAHFGLHLTLDAYKCDKKVANSRKEVVRFLNTLVRRLEMKKLIEPVAVSAGANDKKDPGGVSGFVMIQESHISIHTFPKRGFISIDAYSCTDFDYKDAISYIKTFFRTKSVEVNVIVRGKRYPKKNLL